MNRNGTGPKNVFCVFASDFGFETVLCLVNQDTYNTRNFATANIGWAKPQALTPESHDGNPRIVVTTTSDPIVRSFSGGSEEDFPPSKVNRRRRRKWEPAVAHNDCRAIVYRRQSKVGLSQDLSRELVCSTAVALGVGTS
ncbi:hypothetical protein Bbelb_144570 [Branchiostoma belcheri]|nr:hypothetical protein Bbelb_144570 [Branchiostoma belcheri]